MQHRELVKNIHAIGDQQKEILLTASNGIGHQ